MISLLSHPHIVYVRLYGMWMYAPPHVEIILNIGTLGPSRQADIRQNETPA